jgi:predicted DNA binding protein
MESPDADPYHVDIEIENKFCRVMRILEKGGEGGFGVIDVRETDNGKVRHLVRLPSQQADDMSKEMPVKKVGSRGEESYIWFDSDGCEICETILSHGSFLVSGNTTEDRTLAYTFISLNYEAFQNTVSEFEAKGLKPEILRVEKYSSKGEVLTERQERVLWLALKMGFFEYPRKLSMKELSRKIGVSMSTLSEIMRRGFRRLLESHFES